MLKKLICASSVVVVTTILSSAFALNAKQTEINKQNVIAFYNKALNQKDFAAASQYLGDHYTQHNPLVEDGPQGLKKIIELLRNKYPDSHSEIKRVIAEDDYVILHVHSVREPGMRGRAIFDLFKLENGKIVEHWDTVQDIPETSANNNGMF